MTSIGEREWSELTVVWRADSDLGPERLVRAVVTRQSRWMRILLAIEIAITVIVLGAVVAVVAVHPTRLLIAWGIAAFVHSTVVWGFALWNRRGVWRPLGESTREYLLLAIERTQRARSAAWFTIALVALETALTVAVAGGQALAVSWRWIAPIGVVGGATGWGIWVLARSSSRLAQLRDAARGLGLDESGLTSEDR